MYIDWSSSITFPETRWVVLAHCQHHRKHCDVCLKLILCGDGYTIKNETLDSMYGKSVAQGRESTSGRKSIFGIARNERSPFSFMLGLAIHVGIPHFNTLHNPWPLHYISVSPAKFHWQEIWVKRCSYQGGKASSTSAISMARNLNSDWPYVLVARMGSCQRERRTSEVQD